MDLKKIGKALLYPHIAIMILLIPFSLVSIVLAMVKLGVESPIAIVTYVVSAYTLTIWCFKIPYLIKFWNSFKNNNKYMLRWRRDPRLRINVTLYVSLGWNAIYGLFQLWLGFYHSTFWFYSLGSYYICLAAMRFFLVRHTTKYAPGEKQKDEIIKYRTCGIVFFVLNLALTFIIFFMVYWNRTFNHHMITAIAMAAYTFTALTAAIINIIRYRKYNSPVFSASKAISLSAALVSVLTLESTMLTAFGNESMTAFERKIMLGATGCAISLFVISTAVYMIVCGNKKLKELEQR